MDLKLVGTRICMENIESKDKTLVDHDDQLKLIFNDFLSRLRVDLHVLIDTVQRENSTSLVEAWDSNSSIDHNHYLKYLLQIAEDPLDDRDTKLQKLILNLFKVDKFRNSVPFGSFIKKTASELSKNTDLQKWVFNRYMQIALLIAAKKNGVKLNRLDKIILRQYSAPFNKLYFSKLLKIYWFKIPFFIPLICSLILATVGQIPLSFHDVNYAAPVGFIDFHRFLNNYGGGYFIFFSALWFYSAFFKEKLLYKSLSLRNSYRSVFRVIKDKLLTSFLSFLVLILSLTYLPQSYFYSDNSVGYLISERKYDEALNKINSSDMHIEQKNYAKAQVFLAQKEKLSEPKFKQQFNLATDKIVADYRNDSLPNWTSSYVIADILNQRNIKSDLMSFNDSKIYLFICIFLYFFGFIFAKHSESKINQFQSTTKSNKTVERMMF